MCSALAYCEDTLTETTGWFSPPDTDKDGRYENNLNCWWVIKANYGLGTQLAILDMYEDPFQLAADPELQFLFKNRVEQCHDYIEVSVIFI